MIFYVSSFREDSARPSHLFPLARGGTSGVAILRDVGDRDPRLHQPLRWLRMLLLTRGSSLTVSQLGLGLHPRRPGPAGTKTSQESVHLRASQVLGCKPRCSGCDTCQRRLSCGSPNKRKALSIARAEDMRRSESSSTFPSKLDLDSACSSFSSSCVWA